jgi:hypothetical protein
MRPLLGEPYLRQCLLSYYHGKSSPWYPDWGGPAIEASREVPREPGVGLKDSGCPYVPAGPEGHEYCEYCGCGCLEDCC